MVFLTKNIAVLLRRVLYFGETMRFITIGQDVPKAESLALQKKFMTDESDQSIQELAILAHTQGHTIGGYDVQGFVHHIIKKAGKHKSELKIIYLIGCEAGFDKKDGKPSIAQQIADEFYKKGHREIVLYAVKNSDPYAAIRVEVISQAGVSSLLGYEAGRVIAYGYKPAVFNSSAYPGVFTLEAMTPLENYSHDNQLSPQENIKKMDLLRKNQFSKKFLSTQVYQYSPQQTPYDNLEALKSIKKLKIKERDQINVRKHHESYFKLDKEIKALDIIRKNIEALNEAMVEKGYIVEFFATNDPKKDMAQSLFAFRPSQISIKCVNQQSDPKEKKLQHNKRPFFKVHLPTVLEQGQQVYQIKQLAECVALFDEDAFHKYRAQGDSRSAQAKRGCWAFLFKPRKERTGQIKALQEAAKNVLKYYKEHELSPPEDKIKFNDRKEQLVKSGKILLKTVLEIKAAISKERNLKKSNLLVNLEQVLAITTEGKCHIEPKDHAAHILDQLMFASQIQI